MANSSRPRRFLVFGASGACGRRAVARALERGHEVTAVVRETSDTTGLESCRLVVGDVLDARFVKEAVAGHDAVLSGLGLRRANLLPWSSLRSPPDLVERFTRNVVSALGDAPRVPLIWISAGGVGDSRAACTVPIRWLIDRGNVGVAYRDLARAEDVARESGVAAVAVRPVTLRPGGSARPATEVGRYGLLSLVRRDAVARLLVLLAEKPAPDGPVEVLVGGR